MLTVILIDGFHAINVTEDDVSAAFHINNPYPHPLDAQPQPCHPHANQPLDHRPKQISARL